MSERTPESIAEALSQDLDLELFDDTIVTHHGDHFWVAYDDGLVFRIDVHRVAMPARLASATTRLHRANAAQPACEETPEEWADRQEREEQAERDAIVGEDDAEAEARRLIAADGLGDDVLPDEEGGDFNRRYTDTVASVHVGDTVRYVRWDWDSRGKHYRRTGTVTEVRGTGYETHGALGVHFPHYARGANVIAPADCFRLVRCTHVHKGTS